MTRRITIRSLLEELLKNEDLIISYTELLDGGFDLSVRYDYNFLNAGMEAPKNNE